MRKLVCFLAILAGCGDECVLQPGDDALIAVWWLHDGEDCGLVGAEMIRVTITQMGEVAFGSNPAWVTFGTLDGGEVSWESFMDRDGQGLYRIPGICVESFQVLDRGPACPIHSPGGPVVVLPADPPTADPP